jgi:hypothetical protein
MAFPLRARMIALWQRPPTNITELAKQAPAEFAVQTRAAGPFAIANARRRGGSRHRVMAVILLVCRFWREA